jgi:hypothetical protein
VWRIFFSAMVLMTDDDNDYLALDGLEDAPMLQIHLNTKNEEFVE